MRLFSLFLVGLLLLPLASCRSDDAIIGTWTRRADSGEIMRYTFRSDGTMRIVTIPAVGDAWGWSAQFSLEGDTLLSLSDEEGTERIPIAIHRDTLVLFNHETGVTSRLVRVQPEGRTNAAGE